MSSSDPVTRRPVAGGGPIESVFALLKRVPPLRGVLSARPEPRSPARARREIVLALVYGAATHALFAAAVLAMIVGMGFGMTLGLGSVPQPWAWAVNLALIAQFPLGHSLFLTQGGRRLLGRLAPFGAGATLSTTTYALIASAQLLALFALWTPSGVVWWRAEGWALWALLAAYGASWLLLLKASWDAGAEVQSGLLGWASLARGVKPVFPPMPTTGLFRWIRHPIYLSFALTTWTVPVWTPDQLLIAVSLTLYCALGPLAKERRFNQFFGDAWRRYRAATPYWIPRLAALRRRPDTAE